MKKATPTITEKTNQQPETVTYYNKAANKWERVELSVGMGATYNCVNDCYPHTVWGWHLSKAGVLTVYTTNDAYTWVPKDEKNRSIGEYVYTQYEPNQNAPAHATKIGFKQTRLTLNGRKFYNNPEI